MPFHFTCPHCHVRTLVDDRYAGRSGPCAQCGKTIHLPGTLNESPPLHSPALSRKRWRVSLWLGRLLAVAIVLLLVGYASLTAILPAWRKAVLERNRSLSLSNLRQIANALNAYATQYGSYPPPVTSDAQGKPLYSWRVLILPQLGHAELYEQFDKNQPWDGTTNQTLTSSMPDVFASPSSPDAKTLHECSYFLLTGNGTLFPGSGPLPPDAVSDPRNGTLLVVESGNGGIIWSQPGDVDTSRGIRLGSIPYKQIGGNDSEGAAAAAVDGTPLFLPLSTPQSTLRGLVTPAGGEPIPIEAFHHE